MAKGAVTGNSTGTFGLGRQLWPQNAIYDEVIRKGPTLGMLPKDTNFHEDIRHIVVGIGAPQGTGASFSAVKKNKTSGNTKRFQITAKTYYAAFSIEGRVLRQAKSDKAVIVKPYAHRSKLALDQWHKDQSAYLFGNGGGALGQISATGFATTNAYFDLTDTSKIRHFVRDMTITTSTADGTSGSEKVGTLTVGKAVYSGTNKGRVYVQETDLGTGIPTIAAADYVFREGTFGDVLTGFAGWLPSADPSGGDSHFGVNRSTDPQLLAGHRIDCSGKTPLDQVMHASRNLADIGGMPDCFVSDTAFWEKLRIDLEGAGALVRTQAPASAIGSYKPGMKYEAIQVMGHTGPIQVVADPDCPTGIGYMLQKDTWTLASTGPLVQLIESPMMEESADAWESRFVGDLQLYCEAPFYNAYCSGL